MAPKTEYVSAQYVTLQGQQQTLSFPRGAELGGVVSYTHTHTKTVRRQGEIVRGRERGERESGKQRLTGGMQKELCLAFSKYYPFVEVGLIVDEALFLDFVDRPLLHAAGGKTIEVIFTRQTDMRHIDKCFRGGPTFEEDMRESPAASE